MIRQVLLVNTKPSKTPLYTGPKFSLDIKIFRRALHAKVNTFKCLLDKIKNSKNVSAS